MSIECPGCGAELAAAPKCARCGAAMSISPTTGNVVWTRRGRVIAAPADTKEQWIAMARRNGIPESEWPEQYQN